jgi:WhiB family redox-sensing transcriptional regulator
MGPALFFPAGERDAEAVAQIAAAKEVCAGCGVRLHCLAYAIAANPEEGVWGGLSPSERRVLRRARRLRSQKRSRRAAPATAVQVAAHTTRCSAR